LLGGSESAAAQRSTCTTLQRMRFVLTAAFLLAIASAAVFWLLPGMESADMFAPSLRSSGYNHDAARAIAPIPTDEGKADVAAAPYDSLARETRDRFLARFRTNPQAAAEWLLELPDHSRQSIIDDLEIRSAFNKAANDLSDAAYHQTDPDFADVQHFLQHWAAIDLGAARDWIHQQPAGDRRDAFVARIIFVLSKQDPATAAHWVIDEIEPGPAQNESAISVLHQWALHDFSAAEIWVQSFPEGPLRERAISELKGVASYVGLRSKAY